MTSIKTVAQQAQVSIATVSRVLNGTKYVSPDVEKRVLDADQPRSITNPTRLRAICAGSGR